MNLVWNNGHSFWWSLVLVVNPRVTTWSWLYKYESNTSGIVFVFSVSMIFLSHINFAPQSEQIPFEPVQRLPWNTRSLVSTVYRSISTMCKYSLNDELHSCNDCARASGIRLDVSVWDKSVVGPYPPRSSTGQSTTGPLDHRPSPTPRSVCVTSPSSIFSSLSLDVPTTFHIFPPGPRFIRYNKQLRPDWYVCECVMWGRNVGTGRVRPRNHYQIHSDTIRRVFDFLCLLCLLWRDTREINWILL
jgi:hypothetical protein